MYLSLHRLFYVSNLAGAAGAAIFICSYQRVACHLQDPLKGFCLAFAIVFYFLFCKKGLSIWLRRQSPIEVILLFFSVQSHGTAEDLRCHDGCRGSADCRRLWPVRFVPLSRR